ncbi:MAG TPA: hypothetical protein VIW29_07940 [Polyangiaceae bacterium]
MTSSVKRRYTQAIALVLLLGSSSALGQASDESSTSSSRGAAAEALFQQGVELSERGQLREACAKFEASQGLDVAVGTLLYLADCYERSGRPASAWARFREASSLAQAQSMPDRAHMASVRADALEPKLSHVEIRVARAEQPSDLIITLDGTPIAPASWGTPLPVDPGVLKLRASASGYQPFERSLDVPTGAAARLGVELPALVRVTTPTAVSSTPPPETSSVGRTLAFTTTIMGGAGLAAAGVLALMASSKNDDSLDHCAPDPNHCTPQGVELRNDAGRLADIATVSAAIGGAFVVTGIVLFATSKPASSRETAAFRLTPTLGLRGGGLQAGGSF